MFASCLLITCRRVLDINGTGLNYKQIEPTALNTISSGNFQPRSSGLLVSKYIVPDYQAA